MALPRAAVPTLLLALLAAGGLWLWAHAPHGAGAAGAYGVEVVGPGGEKVWAGTVRVESGTPLSVLRAAAAEGGFGVEVEGLAGGPCGAFYVAAVAGHRAAGAAGWEYWIRRGAGPWTLPDEGAGCHELSPGDRVLWRWTERPSSPADAPDDHAPTAGFP